MVQKLEGAGQLACKQAERASMDNNIVQGAHYIQLSATTGRSVENHLVRVGYRIIPWAGVIGLLLPNDHY